MRKFFACRGLTAAAGCLLLVAIAPGAHAYSARVNAAFENDYYRFCSAYAVGSSPSAPVLEASRRSLTKRCIVASTAKLQGAENAAGRSGGEPEDAAQLTTRTDDSRTSGAVPDR